MAVSQVSGRNVEPRIAGSRRRYSVGLPASLLSQVQKYAAAVHSSMSEAIAALVRMGIDSQANRKREFFDKLKQNLAQDDAGKQEQSIDEFRDLILGR